MTIYIVIFTLFLFLAYYYDYRCINRGYEKWVNISWIILFLLAGLRNHVGGDTFNYINKFDEWPDIIEFITEDKSISDFSQPLWYIINGTLKVLCEDFVIVQLFHAFIYNYLIIRFIRKTTSKFFVALLFIYCITWWNCNFEIMRESLCIAIYLNSLLALKNKSVGKYILINIPALFIHYFSYIIIIATLIIYYIKPKYYLLLICVLIATVFMIDTSFVMDYAFQLYSSDDLVTKMEDYLDSEFYGYKSLNIFGIIVEFLILLQPIIIIIYKIKRKNMDLGGKLLIMYLLLYIMMLNISIFSRFCNYLIPVLIIETINYLQTNKTISHYFVLVLFIWSGISGIYNFYKPSELEISNRSYDCRYIPYKSIFELPDPIREREYGL